MPGRAVVNRVNWQVKGTAISIMVVAIVVLTSLGATTGKMNSVGPVISFLFVAVFVWIAYLAYNASRRGRRRGR